MPDYLCKYCQDLGGSCCCDWCHVEHKWVFIACAHDDCHRQNGTHQYTHKR